MEFFDQLSMPTILKRRASSNRISLRVNESGLRINAGNHIPTTEIERFVLKKSAWINKQWQKYELVMNEDGCLHLGELKSPEFFENTDLESFYRIETKRIIEGLLEIHNENNEYGINQVFIKGQRTRWGSCSSVGNLNFNWRLAMAPTEVIEYVVIHELCHRVEMNHSKEFWRLVQAKCPDFKKHKSWLKRNQFRLSI
jgi:predicted metal-dependent hydrolase